jgi:glycosyltransferase involved in cell wall biosynthesis
VSRRIPVLLDGRHLSGLGATRGFGRYLRSLLPELAAREELAISALVGADALEALPAGVRPVLVSRLRPGRFTDLEHRLRLPLEIARHRTGVFHSASDERPPWLCASPWVHTIHDVPLSFAGAQSEAQARTWRRRRRAARRADAVVAVSRYVAENATAALDLDPARVRVIHSGAASIFSPPPRRGPGSGAPAGADPYLLIVCDFAPHKGFAEAFELIGVLAARGLPHRLVQVGRILPWLRPQVEELIARSPHPERIQLAGPAEDEALLRWYRGADALVLTSRAEGFGLPAVEAMACATPVVSFDNSALPEVIGDGGTLTPDGDVPALAAAVEALVCSPERWRAASAAALRRSRVFSWSACAAAHLQLFTELHRCVPGRVGALANGTLPEAL